MLLAPVVYVANDDVGAGDGAGAGDATVVDD